VSPRFQLDRLQVVLVAPRNPLNIGAAARAMANFGFHRLRVVNPYQLAFHEARSAVGASSILTAAEEFSTVRQAVADCQLVIGTASVCRREPLHPVQYLANAALLIRKRIAADNTVAMLFGSEKRGLSNAELSHCHWVLRIPTFDDQPSMNLGQAVAICLHEIARNTLPASAPQKSAPAVCSDLERLTRRLLETLSASGYLKPHKPGKSKHPKSPPDEKIRRLVRRLQLSAADAKLLLGILRQILWKIDVLNSHQ
jgi:TrmH family RNA methyltransferase